MRHRAEHAIAARTEQQVQNIMLQPEHTAMPHRPAQPCHSIKGWTVGSDRHPVPVRTASHRHLPPNLLQCSDLHPRQEDRSCFSACQNLVHDPSYQCPDNSARL